MKTHVLLALVGLATGFITPAFTQTTIPKELVGTWTIVSITQEQDGKKIDLFGAQSADKGNRTASHQTCGRTDL
jgi:hypothetical protein